jgi:hypothetical protein
MLQEYARQAQPTASSREWRDAGVFERFWQNGLLACEHLDAIDWSWLSLDGCMTKSPLAGSKKQAATPQTAVNRE